MLMSISHITTYSHADAHGPCCHMKPCWCLDHATSKGHVWILSPTITGSVLMSMAESMVLLQLGAMSLIHAVARNLVESHFFYSPYSSGFWFFKATKWIQFDYSTNMSDTSSSFHRLAVEEQIGLRWVTECTGVLVILLGELHPSLYLWIYLPWDSFPEDINIWLRFPQKNELVGCFITLLMV